MATLAFFKDIDEFRQNVKGWDASQPLSELYPSYQTAIREIISLIGETTWNLLKEYHTTPSDPVDDKKASSVGFIQTALANLIMYEHYIFLASKRNNTDQSLYRYQYEEIKEKYQATAMAGLNSLLDLLDANTAIFADYALTSTYKDREDLIIRTYQEFEKYYGIDRSPYFFSKTVLLIREITDDEILPRIGKWDDVKDQIAIAEKVKRALAYQTMALAMERFDFVTLPRSIRNQVANESSRTTRNAYSEDAAKLKLAQLLKDKAAEYLTDIELEMRQPLSDDFEIPEDLNNESLGFYQIS
ncbi:MAG: hypothetical protein WCW62_12575 [Bacteroidales bacterium]|jgi:hypothetical protein